MTAIAAALDRAGFDRNRLQMRFIVENFCKAGGTFEDWVQCWDEFAPKELLDDGQVRNDQPVQGVFAVAQQPNMSGEAVENAVVGPIRQLPPARAPIPDLGQSHKGNVAHIDNAEVGKPIASGVANVEAPARAKVLMPPAREPSTASIHAMSEAKRRSARSILDMKLASDGTPWGDFKPYELPGVIRDAKVAKAFMRELGNLNTRQEKTPIRHLLTEDQAKRVFEQVERANDE